MLTSTTAATTTPARAHHAPELPTSAPRTRDGVGGSRRTPRPARPVAPCGVSPTSTWIACRITAGSIATRAATGRCRSLDQGHLPGCRGEGPTYVIEDASCSQRAVDEAGSLGYLAHRTALHDVQLLPEVGSSHLTHRQHGHRHSPGLADGLGDLGDLRAVASNTWSCCRRVATNSWCSWSVRSVQRDSSAQVPISWRCSTGANRPQLPMGAVVG